ncbi:ASCH domain-containing protein [Amycolatopsis sp. NPDC003865]
MRQPWATLIATGQKRVENRSWRTHYRGPLAIQAAVKHDPAGWRHGASSGLDRRTVVRGAVVALVQLVDVVRDSTDPFAVPGRWHWILNDVVALDRPVPLLGTLGLFRAPAAVAEEITNAAS